MKKSLLICAVLVQMLILAACATIPDGATAVSNLEKERYLGKWYEIARLDFAFEKDLNNTSAEYTLRSDGLIDVTNRGYNYKKGSWQEANGIAKFRGKDTVGALEVSFFGPFFAAYNIIELDSEYKYALIVGSSTEYLWILSRDKTIPDDIKTRYISIAESLGYNINELIWVEHSK